MANNLQVIQQTLTSADATKRLALSLGFSENDERGKAEAFKYASSVFAEVQRTAGDSKKDLTGCTPGSIVQAMIDAADLKVKIGAQQHAHLVKYGNNVTLQVGYRAYLAKIKEIYPDAEFVVEPIYEGDDLQIMDENGIQKYMLKKGAAFNDGADKFKGILFVVSYTSGQRFVQKVQAVPKSRIDRAKAAAKQDFIWKSDYIEKAKAAAIKASCKILFASIQGMQDMIRRDNEANFDVSGDVEMPAPTNTIRDNLNKALQDIDGEAEKVPEHPVIENKAEPVQPITEDEMNMLETEIVNTDTKEDLKAAMEKVQSAGPRMTDDQKAKLNASYKSQLKIIREIEAKTEDTEDMFPGDRP